MQERRKKKAVPLAPYHLSVKTVGRAKGRSATAACAYRSGERIEDQRTGQVFDYSKRGGVERTQCEIFAPENAPAWVQNRQELWNQAEAAETRINSTVAREFEVALPADLSGGERKALVDRFATALVERHGIVVDASIHAPDAYAGKGQGNRNHHAHVLCSTRRIGEDGFGPKSRELDTRKSGEVMHWRESFAAMCGDALEQAGHPLQAARWRAGYLLKVGQIEAARERGDEAFVAENKDRVPTKHFGPNVIQIERKGVVTERGEKAREPERMNAQVIDMAEARARIAAERAEAEQEPTRPESTGTGLLDAARGDRRVRLLDVPQPAASRAPEIVLREWRSATDRQFTSVVAKAQKVDTQARRLLNRHQRRQAAHERAKPDAPAGLFAAVRRGAHDVATKAWEATRAAIERRIARIGEHIDKIAGYMRRAFPHEVGGSPGERLAETKAAAASPELAAEHYQQERNAMAKEATLYTRSDRDVQAEKDRLERDGKLAAKLSDSIEKEAQDAKPKVPTEQEKRVQAAREQIKAQRDRERDDKEKGKSRGHER